MMVVSVNGLCLRSYHLTNKLLIGWISTCKQVMLNCASNNNDRNLTFGL